MRKRGKKKEFLKSRSEFIKMVKEKYKKKKMFDKILRPRMKIIMMGRKERRTENNKERKRKS